MQFELDGEALGSFVKPDSTTPEATYTYNYLVYANDQLALESHTFTLTNGQQGSTSPALTLLDYLVYTTEESDEMATILPNPSPSPPSPSSSIRTTSSSATVVQTVTTVVHTSTTTETSITAVANNGSTLMETTSVISVETLSQVVGNGVSSSAGTISSIITHASPTTITVGDSTIHPSNVRTRDIAIAVSVGGGALSLIIATLALWRRRRRGLVSSSSERLDVHRNTTSENPTDEAATYVTFSTVPTREGESRIANTSSTIRVLPRARTVTSGRSEKPEIPLPLSASPVSRRIESLPGVEQDQDIQSVTPSWGGSENPPPYHSTDDTNRSIWTRIY